LSTVSVFLSLGSVGELGYTSDPKLRNTETVDNI
jgi:hypothetical protein